MRTTLDKLQETFNQMPDIFTSRQFCNVARKNGVDESDILKGRCAYFYKKHAILKYENPKRWVKNPIEGKKSFTGTIEQLMAENYLNKENDAIIYLKAKGYKIMKPKTEWEEM